MRNLKLLREDYIISPCITTAHPNYCPAPVSGYQFPDLHFCIFISFPMSAVLSNTSVYPQEQAAIEEQYNVLFCRALYDYEAQDASALSFRRDDIIEVLTQQPSGWWDGLLGKERGWFPSNYVIVMTDEEAELAFTTADYSTIDGQNSGIQLNAGDTLHSISGSTQGENEEWLDNELSFRNGLREKPTEKSTCSLQSNQPSDFWMPEVTPDGQVGLIFE